MGTRHEEEKSEAAAAYKIKVVQFFGRQVPVILQNDNGPCPLLAICNALLLRNNVNISTDMKEISLQRLLSLVAERLLDANSNIKDKDDEYLQNQQQNIADAIELLPRLATGLDVNVQFRHIHDFEFTPECAVFDLLDIGLVHGWLYDPQDEVTSRVLGANSYNTLVEKLVELQANGMQNHSMSLSKEDFVDSEALLQTISLRQLEASCLVEPKARKGDFEETDQLPWSSENENIDGKVSEEGSRNMQSGLNGERANVGTSELGKVSDSKEPLSGVEGLVVPLSNVALCENRGISKVTKGGSGNVPGGLDGERTNMDTSESGNVLDLNESSSGGEGLAVPLSNVALCENQGISEVSEEGLGNVKSGFDGERANTDASELGKVSDSKESLSGVEGLTVSLSNVVLCENQGMEDSPSSTGLTSQVKERNSNADGCFDESFVHDPTTSNREVEMPQTECLPDMQSRDGQDLYGRDLDENTLAISPETSITAPADTQPEMGSSQERAAVSEDCNNTAHFNNSAPKTVESPCKMELVVPDASAKGFENRGTPCLGEVVLVAEENAKTKHLEDGDSPSKICNSSNNSESLSEAVSEGMIIESFLNNNASQLTYYGLFCLQEGLKERELCVFFRNNHFSTMFKYKGDLYLLVTDQGYLNQSDLVWEKLHEVHGDSVFVTGNFTVFQVDEGCGSWNEQDALAATADFLSTQQTSEMAVQEGGHNSNSDFRLAMALQQEEFEQQQRSRPLGSIQTSSQEGRVQGRPEAGHLITGPMRNPVPAKQEAKKEKCTVM